MGKIFEACDKGGDSQISKSELIARCKRDPAIAAFFGLPIHVFGPEHESELQAFFEGADVNGGGQMTFEELRMFYMSHSQGSEGQPTKGKLSPESKASPTPSKRTKKQQEMEKIEEEEKKEEKEEEEEEEKEEEEE